MVPLIGGHTIGMDQAYNSRPEFLVSFPGFQDHDQHLRKWYNDEVPYHIADGSKLNLESVDVVSTTCPCAGLSSLSPSSSAESATNDWMSKSAELVLGEIKPKVLWGENAPRLASKMGEPTVNKLRSIGKKYGYTFSLVKTKSLIHGLSQTRDRSFYFFWKGDQIPIFNFIKREREPVEDLLRNTVNNPEDPMSEVPNKKTPSDDPWYRFVLEEMHGGITHPEFAAIIPKTINPFDHIERNGVSYLTVKKWMSKNGFEKRAIRCQTIHDKLAAGGSIMRRGVEVPKGHTGAFVGHLPVSLTHPDIDRFITIRESMNMMKLPETFQLQGGIKNLNHICQNVPVTTSKDMALEIEKYLTGKLDAVNSEFLIQDFKNQTVEWDSGSSLNEHFV